MAVRRWLGRVFGVSLMGLASVLVVGVLMSAPAASAAYGPAPTGSVPQQSPGTAPSAPQQQASPAPSTAPSTGVLAFTGAEIGATVLVGALAIGGGGALVLASRRRRTAAESA